MRSHRGAGYFFLAIACAAVHAAASFYWAFGGSWGIEGVGQWAVDARRDAPLLSGLILVVLGLAKLAGGVVPYLASIGRIPGRRPWRRLSAAGAALLTIYGVANVTVGGAALGGLLQGPTDPADRHALLMHVVLWDPLFLVWGVALLFALWSSRSAADESSAPSPARVDAGVAT